MLAGQTIILPKNLLLDLPANAAPIAAGEFSSGITPRGKPGPAAPRGTRQGINDYTAWFAGDANMSGDYYGYDGPCPPWNDERPHHYIFRLYALDTPRLQLEGRGVLAQTVVERGRARFDEMIERFRGQDFGCAGCDEP